MVILITYEETDKNTGRKAIVVSHGYDTESGKNVVLPTISPNEIGVFNEQTGHWILN